MNNLTAMILCGGKGTRLREFTEVLPKPMVEVGGKPILWHIMKIYNFYGISKFILCTGYKSDVIRRYFLEYEAMNADFTVTLGERDSIKFHDTMHSDHGIEVTVAYTGDNAMTGSRVKQAAKYLGDSEKFLLTYGDGVADVNIAELVKFHDSHDGLVSLTGVRPPSRFGQIELNDSQIVAFEEKPQVLLDTGLINGGYMVMDKAFLDYLSEDQSCILERDPLSKCAKNGQLFMYEHDGFWQCMDTHRDWALLEDLWISGKAPWKVW